MEPPAPTSTAGVPHASARADGRACVRPSAGPGGERRGGGAGLDAHLRAPRARAPAGARPARRGPRPASSPGATRRLTLARAAGMSVLEAAATDGASMPMTAMAGPAHSRSVRRAGAGQLRPRRAARPRRGTALRSGRAGRRRRRGPGRAPRRRRARRAGWPAAGTARSARRGPGRRTGRCARRAPASAPPPRRWSPPRSVVVSAGTSAVQFTASANTTTSARSRSA